MKTISELISQVMGGFGGRSKVRYVHPTIYVVCADTAFEGMDDEERSAHLLERIHWTQDEVEDVLRHGLVQLLLLTPDEYKNGYDFIEESDAGDHWLSWFASDRARQRETVQAGTAGQQSCRALHFYGFKGGQARSSVLILLAKALADDGARVLVVDADVEAPSLDALFDVSADDVASTLMGLCGWAESIDPLARVYVGQGEAGTVDLIACRPRRREYDADFAGFLLSTTFDARVLESAARRLQQYCAQHELQTLPRARYDFVLFDHRTGLAPSVLPILRGWPGPTVIFARPDGMSRGLEHSGVLDALLRHGAETPGMFVTFSLDPKDTRAAFIDRHGKFIERLLESLSDALTAGDPGAPPIDPSELEQSWLLWRHDPALLARAAPTPSQLAPDNLQALSQMREILGVNSLAHSPLVDARLTRSGATDEGAFILTPDFARLFSLDSKVLYIFGRKGTGKTRLVRELFERKLGHPLLVAQDFPAAGVRSPSAEFTSLMRACRSDHELFWWALFRSGLSDPDNIAAGVNHASSLSIEELRAWADLSEIEGVVAGWDVSDRRVYLIDGVETAVPASQMRPFVEALFRFLGGVQYSRILSRFATVRLFLRSDLQRGAAQNVEQQIEGSSLQLRWNRASILNFAVARLASLPWFRENFGEVCSRIDDKMPTIEKGALSEEDAEGLLLDIFPRGLERNKVKTTTFFATYFSDAGGDNEAKASFYPRLFDGFLREMNERRRHLEGKSSIKDGKVESSFVLRAYDEASGVFIEEVKTELFNLLDLAGDDTQNREAVSGLISAFAGLKTPFSLDQITGVLAERTKLDADRIRDALGRMKQLGIFEDRPGYPGEWRTGRLYKAGLQMKYVR